MLASIGLQQMSALLLAIPLWLRKRALVVTETRGGSTQSFATERYSIGRGSTP